MDILLRTIAVVIEVSILAGIIGSILVGVKLMLLDLGVDKKYNRMFNVVFGIIAVIAVTFFILHLTTFYPGDIS